MSTQKKGGEWLILLAALGWSLGGTIIRQLPVSALMANALRSLIGGVLLLGFNRFRVRINRTILLAGLCVALTNILYFLSLERTTVANAVVIQYLMPVYVLVFTCLKERRRPGMIPLTAIVLAFAGVYLVFASDLSGGLLVGNLLALASGITFAGVFILNKLPESSSVDSSILGFGMNVVVGLFFLGELPLLDARGWLLVAALGILQHGLPYIFFAKGIKRCTGFGASLISMAELVFAPIWAGLFLGEWPSWIAAAGFALIVAGILVNMLHESRAARRAG